MKEQTYCPYFYIIFIPILIVVVACTPTDVTPTSQPTAIPATSTPFPTPQPEFATIVSASQADNTSDSILNPTVQVTQTTYTGILSSQVETIRVHNGPQGAVLEEVNNLAPITVLGRSDNGQWIEVRLEGGFIGWVQGSFVDANVSMNSLPITGYVPQDTPTPSPDALVKADAAGLRLRTQPNTDSNVLTNLDAESILTVIGRDSAGEWLQVITPNRQRGWAMARFLDIYIDVLRLPVTFGTDPSPQANDTVTSAQSSGVISNITSEAQNIFDRGLSVGNRADVFSKIGDSLTVATWAFYPIGWGQQQLGDYGYLQSVVDNFSSEVARDNNNSFSNVPLAADNQWTTFDLLNPQRGNPDICGINETPLDCEFRVVRPSIAFILIGTNDVETMDGATYRQNLETILDKTIARSVLPVLSTLPNRSGFEEQIAEFNTIIRETATQYQIPIWELNNSLSDLPNDGLDEDGVHLSYPPDTLEQWEASANFIGNNLDYGYNIRNLTALQVLDAIWRQVILGEGQ